MKYWNTKLPGSAFRHTECSRYISFDVDQGGLNNIRLVFEYVVVIAAITGRTLVLPPAQSWYLINHGPKHVGKSEGATKFSEIFDIPALQQVVRVLTTEEFIQESTEHLSIPTLFLESGAFSFSDTKDANWKLWQQWLSDNSRIPDWSPYETLIAYPDMTRVDMGRVSNDYVDRRQFVEFTPELNAAPIIHFPSNSEHRFLGPVATMLAAEDDELPRLCRRLLKHHIRYNPTIFRPRRTVYQTIARSL